MSSKVSADELLIFRTTSVSPNFQMTSAQFAEFSKTQIFIEHFYASKASCGETPVWPPEWVTFENSEQTAMPKNDDMDGCVWFSRQNITYLNPDNSLSFLTNILFIQDVVLDCGPRLGNGSCYGDEYMYAGIDKIVYIQVINAVESAMKKEIEVPKSSYVKADQTIWVRLDVKNKTPTIVVEDDSELVDYSGVKTPADWVRKVPGRYFCGRAAFVPTFSNRLQAGHTPNNTSDYKPSLKFTLIKMWLKNSVDEKAFVNTTNTYVTPAESIDL